MKVKTGLTMAVMLSFVVALVGIVIAFKYLAPGQPLKREDLAGKVVWITGASSGIGKQLAILCAEYGCKLILSGRNEETLKIVAGECDEAAKRAGSSATPVAKVLPFDLDDTHADDKYSNVKSLWGPVDILINNAGVSTRSPAEQTKVSIDAMVMRVNFLAQVALTKTILPSMLERRSGNIVVISSVQGKLPLPFRSSYSAAKHALQGYFDSLRAEVADRNVKITIVLPGYVKTNLSLNAVTGDGSSYNKMDETTLKGMDPKELALRVMQGVCAGSEEVVVCDLKTRLAMVAKGLFPSLISVYMNSRAKKGWADYRADSKADVGSSKPSRPDWNISECSSISGELTSKRSASANLNV